MSKRQPISSSHENGSNKKKLKTDGEREIDARMSQRERMEKKDWGWKEVLKECGYDSHADNTVGVELQASLTALLKEMHHHGVDVNNERVLNQLQENATDIATLRQWTSTTKKSSWSLLKVLLRVEVLQSTLLTSLMQTLIQLASNPTEDVENDDRNNNNHNDYEGLAKRILSHFKWLDHIYIPNTSSKDNNIEEEEEDGLLKSALECLSLLAVACSSENDDDENLRSHRSYNICLEFLEWLPDLLAFLGHPQQDLVVETLIEMSQEQPDYYLLPSFDVLTTLQYHDESNTKNKEKSNKDVDKKEMSTLAKIIKFAQESLHPIYSHDEDDENNVVNYAAIPTLTQFLLQHAPPQQAIEHLLQQPFGCTTNSIFKKETEAETTTNSSNNSQRKKRKRSKRNQWMSRMEAEAFLLEMIVKAFQYRSDLTKALFFHFNTKSASGMANNVLNNISHVWCLWACAAAPHNRKKVVSTISQLAIRHIWTPATIDNAISKHGSTLLRAVLSQSSGHGGTSSTGGVSPLLFLADALMQCSDTSTRSLGGQLYKSLFLELHNNQHTDQAILCQEIVAQLGMHIGSSTHNNRNHLSTFGTRKDDQEESYMALQVCTSIPPNILRPYRPFWFALLDHIQRLPPRHLRKLFLLLFTVTEDPQNNNNDDYDNDAEPPLDYDDPFSDTIHIVIRKHLSLSSSSMKRIGIIGAVAFAVTKSVQFQSKRKTNDNNNEDDDPKNNPLFGRDIINMLETAYRHCTPLQTFQFNPEAGKENQDFMLSSEQQEDSALAYYFDELCLAVQSKCLASDVSNWILDRFSADLENKYLGDFIDPQGENGEETPISILPTNNSKNHHPLASQQDAALLNGTSDNFRAPPAALRFNIDGEDSLVYVKFLTLLSSKNSFDRNVLPQQLCPLLRLLATCNDIRYGGEGLSEIDAILGCPLLLPSEKSVGFDYEELSLAQRWTTAASTYYAACWCRELINCFIYTAAFPSLVPLTRSSLGSQVTTQEDVRQKVVEKIRCLVQLQEDLVYVASKCHQFTPPCHSILQPPSELIRLSHHVSVTENGEQKENDTLPNTTKTTNKGLSTNIDKLNHMDCENVDTISSKMLANEKKTIAKKATALAKSKQKLVKLRSLYESRLGERSLQSLRDLSPAVCLALGFPELSVANQQPNCRRSLHLPENSSSQELMMTLGPSQLKHFVVGDPVTIFLLSHLCDTLNKTLGNKNSSSKSRFMNLSNKSIKQSKNDDEMNATMNNPYTVSSFISDNKIETDNNASVNNALNTNKNFEFLEMCLKGNVFSAVHEHLATIAEIRGGMRETQGIDDQVETDEMKSCIRLLFNCVTTITSFEELTRSSKGEVFLEVIFKQLADGDMIQNVDLQKHVTNNSLMKYATNLFELIREIITGRESDDLELMIEGIDCLNSILLCSIRLRNHCIIDLSRNSDGKSHMLIMKTSLSTVCLQLLQRQWHKDTKLNKGNVGKLVSLYLEHSPQTDQNEDGKFDILMFSRMGALSKVIVDILGELPNTPNCQGPLDSYPLCSSKTFAYFFSSAFAYLAKEIGFLFSSSIAKSPISTGKTLDVLYTQVRLLDSLSSLTKENPSLAKRPLLLIQLKGGINFLEQFINKGIPYLEINFQERQEGITTLINTLQRSTRQLTNILSFAKRERDTNLTKEAPRSKKILETFIHKMKSLMRKNKVLEAFWGGNLRHKNIDGTFVVEDESDEEESDENHNNSSDSGSESGNDSESETEWKD